MTRQLSAKPEQESGVLKPVFHGLQQKLHCGSVQYAEADFYCLHMQFEAVGKILR